MPTEVKVIERLPIDADGCDDVQIFKYDGAVYAIFSGYEEERLVIRMLVFKGVLALQYSTESAAYRLGDFPGAYDQVVEVVTSKWKEKIDVNPIVQHLKCRRHFEVFFSNCGLLSVIGHSIEPVVELNVMSMRDAVKFVLSGE